MPMPFKSKQMRVKIREGSNVHVLGTVNLTNLEVINEGGVEGKYGLDGNQQPENRHAIGMKRARFLIQRRYKADTGQTAILYNLFNNSTLFTLEELLIDASLDTEFAGLKLENCIIYNHRLVGGPTNEMITEESIGEGKSWDEAIYHVDLVELDPLDWAYFKNHGEIWFNEESGAYYGYPIYFPTIKSLQGFHYFTEPIKCLVQRGTNAIANPSFESDLASWIISHANDFAVDTSIYYDGVKSARYEGIDASGSGAYIAQNLANNVDVNGCLESSSTFSVFIKAENASTSVDYIYIQYSDFSQTQINYTASDTAWHEVDLLSYATAGKAIAQIGVRFLGDGNKFWVDYFRLIP